MTDAPSAPRVARTALAAFLALMLATAATVLPASPAKAEGPPVQPGVAIVTGSSGCTLAWLFQRADAAPDGTTNVSVFGSTAAHCVERVGQEVTLGADGSRLGEVAFLGNADEEGRDYAFIAVDPARYSQVDPAMAGHPNIPTGLS